MMGGVLSSLNPKKNMEMEEVITGSNHEREISVRDLIQTSLSPAAPPMADLIHLFPLITI
jgi:hypothetical protein